jgi:hypothetical protein
LIRGLRIAGTVIFAPISSAPTSLTTTDIDKRYRLSERWQEHTDQSTPHRSTGGTGMPNKIEIRPLDKKETTGDSGGNGGS